MIRIILLAGALGCVAGIYPIHRHVLFDPQNYDLLYNSSSGIISESWYVTTPMTLTGFVLPSRVKECISDDVYNEDVAVTVTRVVSSVNVQVASGRFAGQQAYGQEIYVSMYNSTNNGYPSIERSLTYYVKISLSGGLYPWHNTRPYTSISGFHSITNGAGYIIGVEFSR